MALLLEHQFRPLPADRQVETRPFLEAATYLPPFIDERIYMVKDGTFADALQSLKYRERYCASVVMLQYYDTDTTVPAKDRELYFCVKRKSSTQHSLIVHKVKAVYDTNPGRFRTLQQILEVEKEMYGTQWPKVGATLALMWLKRSLRFIQVFLQSLLDGEKDENNPNLIRVNVTKAYELTLKRYHSWWLQQLFRAALFAAPYRSDFLKALSKGREVKEEECLEKVKKFLINFSVTVDAIYEMYNKMNAEIDYRV